MIAVRFTDEEFKAVYAVMTAAERVDWTAYDAARARILRVGRAHLAGKDGAAICTARRTNTGKALDVERALIADALADDTIAELDRVRGLDNGEGA